MEALTLQVGIKQVASHAFNCIINRKNMNTLRILNIRTLVHRYNIPKTNPKVRPNDFVQSDLMFFTLLIRKDNTNSVLPFFTLQ